MGISQIFGLNCSEIRFWQFFRSVLQFSHPNCGFSVLVSVFCGLLVFLLLAFGFSVFWPIYMTSSFTYLFINMVFVFSYLVSDSLLQYDLNYALQLHPKTLLPRNLLMVLCSKFKFNIV